MYAYELRAKLQAGLQLCGQNKDGELEWMGTEAQWRKAQLYEQAAQIN